MSHSYIKDSNQRQRPKITCLFRNTNIKTLVKYDTSLHYFMGKVDCMRSRDVKQSRFLVIKLFQSTFETAHLGFKTSFLRQLGSTTKKNFAIKEFPKLFLIKLFIST